MNLEPIPVCSPLVIRFPKRHLQARGTDAPALAKLSMLSALLSHGQVGPGKPVVVVT